MKKISAIILLLCCIMSTTVFGMGVSLRYESAGTFPLWTEEGYYSSPEICDVDDDGAMEIIFSNYSITVLDAKSGETKWKVNSGYDRSTACEEFGKSNGHTWPDIVVDDINGDGKKEIITGHGGGVISVLSAQGYALAGWPQKPLDKSVRSIEVADLENDGKKEIIVGYAIAGSQSVYVYNCDGKVRDGWPQLSSVNGSKTWLDGIYMDGIAAEDIDGDGYKEIIVPSDLSFVSVFYASGEPVNANNNVFSRKSWGQVPFYEDYQTSMRCDNGGWGFDIKGGEYREDLFKGEFGHAKAVVSDVDKNGSKEIIVSTIMCDRTYFPEGYPPTEYMTIGIFNADRTRYKNDSLGYNWETIPTDLGKPLFQNEQSVASNVFQVPVVSDIDGDGKNEILFNSYNGKVHCFSLNKKEPYAWPYSLTKRTNPMYQYASPVVCKDLNGDGRQEVIFTSFYDDKQGYGAIRGYLYILNYEGKEIAKVQLPDSKEKGRHANGGKAMPKVCDIDGNGDFEIVINTMQSGICVYDVI